jgi:hypothetical protein
VEEESMETFVLMLMVAALLVMLVGSAAESRY